MYMYVRTNTLAVLRIGCANWEVKPQFRNYSDSSYLLLYAAVMETKSAYLIVCRPI